VSSQLARDGGPRQGRYVSDHVNFLGLGSYKDWELMTKIRDGDYTFVNNNRSDFTDSIEERSFTLDW
jgi:hypothetical protein